MAKIVPIGIDPKLPDNEACLEWLLNRRYPQGIKCPVCNKITKHHKLTKRSCYSCDRCGNQVYPTAGTIFYKTSTPLRIWFELIVRMSSSINISVKEIQRDYGLTYKTAWRVAKKIRKALNEDVSLVTEITRFQRTITNDHTGFFDPTINKNTLMENSNHRTSGIENISVPGSLKTRKSNLYYGQEPSISDRLIKFGTEHNKTEHVKSNQPKKDRTARLLKLEILLWQNPQGLKIEEISRKCFVSRRTVYRDLNTLEVELNIPIWEDGNKRGMAEGYFLPPINLTMIEAFNVYLASRLLQKYSHLYNPGLASTLLKLETIIPKPLKQKIRNSIEYLERQPKDEHKIKNLNILVQAWLSNHRVEILYQALSAKDPEAYIIEPYFIEPILTGRSIYVIAYCHQKNSILAFNLDRIVGKIIVQEDTYEIPPESYEIAPSFNTIEHIDSEWGIDQDEQLINVKLHFKPTVSKYILAAAWHPSQKVSLNHDGSAIATFRVRNTVDFRSWVLGWSDDVEVLEPETFRKQIIDIARALMSNYGLL